MLNFPLQTRRSSELVRESLCIKNKHLLQLETIASYNLGLMNQMQIQNSLQSSQLNFVLPLQRLVCVA